MAETRGTQEPDELKKKLVRRVAIAGVLIAVLLGGLALLDYLMAPEPAPPPPAPTVPAPPPVEQPAEAPKEEPKAEEKEPKAEPEKTVTPLAPPPKPEARPAKPVPGKVEGPAVRFVPGPAAAAKKPEPSPPPKPVEAKPPVLPPLPRGYLLQVGVFSNTANAEELRAKLAQAGIPATIEARVQVGPFKTRKEALEAQEKLKALSVGPGLLIPPKRK